MATRTRTLKYLSGHKLRFGVAASSRDEESGEVVEAVCLFCRHFGREQRAGKKRKSARTVKHFRDSFRPDQYTQHHQLQHPVQWKRYKACTDDEKCQFFPKTNTQLPKTNAEGVPGPDQVLVPKAEERGRSFDLKAEIVEVTAVLAVGFGPVEPTVQTRDRLMYEYMTHRNYNQEEHESAAPRWSPPPNTFQSCYLVREKPPIYRVVVFSKAQMVLLMELAAEGLSAAQITRSVKVFRAHAPMLLSDLIDNTMKATPTVSRAVALAADRAEQRAEEKFRAVDASPEYSEDQTAEFVRLGVAASLSIIAGLLVESWAFSLELCTVAQHSDFSYLDVRVKFYNRIGGLRRAHLLAIPKYVGKCDTMMFQTLDRVLTALLPKWRNKLMGITTNGDIPIPARIIGVIKRFQHAASASALYHTSSCSNQLQRILDTFYASIDGGSFLLTLHAMSGYVRKEFSLLKEMKRYSGYREQLDSWVHALTSSPVSFDQEIDMLVLHSALIQGHFKELAFHSDVILPMPTPPVSWWLALEVLHWVTARASAVFGVLERQHVTISQQAAVMTSLAEECITGFHAQIHEDERSTTRAVPNEFVSLDGRVALSKSNVVEFVMGSSELARELIKNGDTATVHAAADDFAACAVNMTASLVELSVSLKQRCAACTNADSTDVTRTIARTDALPPVLPHELARLSREELVELLQDHDVTSRGGLTEVDIMAIREEHELLRSSFAEDDDLRCALEMCTQGTRFDVAWSLLDARFKSLEAFAGGLATACPSGAVALSDTGAKDLVLCPKDMEEASQLLADFELESALHAQQFQSLTKLQDEIYEREFSERRNRKRQKNANS